MTMVRKLIGCRFWRWLVEGKKVWAFLVVATVSTTAAGQQPAHWLHQGVMPPGAIGRQRLMRGGPLSGYCQPVAIRAPQGTRIAPAAGSGFGEAVADQLLVGLSVGGVYRFRVSEIPEHPGSEVFPTVELVDRLYPPPGQALFFPVPVELTWEELLMAKEGKFVTRVIYVEDPELALPVGQNPDGSTSWIEARPGEDPLVTADGLGRPIAILRMGGRVPQSPPEDTGFFYVGPDPVVYDPPQQPAAGHHAAGPQSSARPAAGPLAAPFPQPVRSPLP